ncbi:ubiquitinyl hydrolase 1 [Pleurotus ostreatus]|nr:ubiquitinyl hydrolase 1 [Pleurotus ostreatus]XP_036629008.1 ubiquitinyl hydrolase 1 [Pleurotus ostreatus]KAF7424806.1 ubiquitinyl hydrolase 1 [Pleurotus ostreatus]KAF7424814.1 ubiquitinyl hydrolase 1 [Pleurotus ostreatus]KAJ8692170.1 ubiquitinyl hydrolase 1 [Pleurotus ostreatus]KAJ8692177.1 ubiquitinyl hydrolase 1 [Pleurotus ostreatus]
MVPQPTKALILIFPLSGQIKEKHQAEDEKLKNEGGGVPVDPTVIWIKQTIRNACGTMALLHSLMNSDVTFAPHSALYQFVEQCQNITPDERAHLLETTTLFSHIHADTASQGQSAVTDEVMNTDLHFAAFVAAPEPDLREKASTGQGVAEAAAADDAVKDTKATGMRLIELDGTRSGPLDRGPCNDFLADAARYIRENYISSSSSVQFSILALGPPA